MTRRLITATMGFASLAAVGVGVIPPLADASSSAPAGKTHTLQFVDKKAGKAIDKGPLLIQADDDYRGKTLVGTDVINCTFGKTAATCLVTLSVKGGFLYGRFNETPQDSLKGSITGGAGQYRGAHGTISGASNKPIVVTYKT